MKVSFSTFFCELFFKGLVHPKIKILSLITLILYQTRKTFVHLWNTNIFLMKSKSSLTLHRQQQNYQIQGHVSLSLYSLRTKIYSRSFTVKLRLNHWCHMDYFNQVKSSKFYCQFFHMYSTYIQRIEIALLSDPWCIQLTLNTDSRHSNTNNDVLTIFPGLECGSTLAVYTWSESSLKFHQNYLNLSSKDDWRSYGLGTTWGWVINDRLFIFGWTIPLRLKHIVHICKV